ncbi:hypothetical protein L2E82_51163 [Cichorium intybus]|nr:hypothetical protein L2E82_51163 [Cichorium intybus]
MDVDTAEEQMMDLQFVLLVSSTLENTEVSKVSCSSQSCVDIIAKYREHNDRLVKEIFYLENDVYNSKKKLRPLQEKLEAKASDSDKLQEEYTIKSYHLKFANEENAELTAELDALKAKYNDVDFSIKNSMHQVLPLNL